MSSVLSAYDSNVLANYRRRSDNPNPVNKKISYINSLYNEIAQDCKLPPAKQSKPNIQSTTRLSSTITSTPAPIKQKKLDFQPTERFKVDEEDDQMIESPQKPIKPTQLLEDAKLQTSPHFRDTNRQFAFEKKCLQSCDDFSENVHNKSTLSGKSGKSIKSGRSQRFNGSYNKIINCENDPSSLQYLQQKWIFPEQTKNKTELINQLFQRVNTYEKSPSQMSSQRNKNFVKLNKLSSSISRQKHPTYEKILTKLNSKKSTSPLFRLDMSQISVQTQSLSNISNKICQPTNFTQVRQKPNKTLHRSQLSHGGKQIRNKQKSFCTEFNSSCDFYNNSHY